VVSCHYKQTNACLLQDNLDKPSPETVIQNGFYVFDAGLSSKGWQWHQLDHIEIILHLALD